MCLTPGHHWHQWEVTGEGQAEGVGWPRVWLSVFIVSDVGDWWVRQGAATGGPGPYPAELHGPFPNPRGG